MFGNQLTASSEEYWKLYDQYADIRQKLADAEDLIDSTKRQLDDARAEREFIPLYNSSSLTLTHSLQYNLSARRN